MDTNPENKIEIKDKLTFFLKKNQKKFIILIIVTFLAIFAKIYYDFLTSKKNNLISQKFIQASLYLANNEKDKSVKIYEEIISSKNKFYSILALNIILEKNLELRKDKIIDYFDVVEKLNILKDQKDLLVFKKALFLIKNGEEKKGLDLLNSLVEKESSLKKLVETIIVE